MDEPSLTPARIALALRLPDRSVLVGWFGFVAKWLLLVFLANAALALGPRTRLGYGVIGAMAPLLVLEAWLAAPRRWRTRLFHALRFAGPACTLVMLLSVMPGTCCFCDHSAGARALRAADFCGDFLYFNATATLPSFFLLAVLRRRSASRAEIRAHVGATVSNVLAALLVTVTFVGLNALLRASAADTW